MRQPARTVRERGPGATLRTKNPAVFDLLESHTGAATVTELSQELGVHSSVIHRWMNSDEEFRETVLAMRESATDKVVGALYKRAIGGTVTEEKAVKIKEDGNEFVEVVGISKDVPGDVAAQKFWLTNRRPEEWADRSVVETEETYHAMLERMRDVIDGEAKDVTDAEG